MVSLGDNITFKATKYQTRYVSNDGRFSVCVFTARFDENIMPKGLKAYGPTVMFVVRGKIPESETGISFFLTGSWEKNSRAKPGTMDDKVFEVTKAVISLPEKEKQIAEFLVAHCKGVGRRIAKKLASQYGAKTLQVCAHEINRVIADFPELASKYKVITALQKSCRSVMILQDLERLLGQVDVSTEALDKIVDEYGDRTVELAQKNAYQFVEIAGFAVADKIAIACGEPLNSDRRVKAGTLEAVKATCKKSGCMCAEVRASVENAKEILGSGVTTDDVNKGLDTLCSEYDLVKQGEYLYVKEDFVTERTLARQVAKFVSCPPAKEKEIELAFQQWQRENSIILSPKQSEAVRNLKYRLSVVTGGPGTGKTTTLKAIMDVYHKVFPKENILLMAPTGLAAKRMTDSTGKESSTIHSACGLIPANNSSGFVAQDGCMISAGFIGIDEMSMVGEHLFSFAMDAIACRPNTRVVLLGDVDQLAPVARGDVLRDLIQCGMVPVTVLDCNYRQGKDSSITDASIKIREDRAYIPGVGGEKCDLIIDDQFTFIKCADADLRKEADEIIEKLVEQYLAAVALYGVAGTIVLTPTHFDKGKPSGYICKDVVNVVIQDKVNPDDGKKASCKAGNQVFRVGDRVIQRKNTPDVINGDLGTIKEIHHIDGDTDVLIAFDSRNDYLSYDLKQMRSVELAYAITVHSSQGCEFPCCILPVSNSYSVMLTRAIYYTGITRAKKKLILIGDEAALHRAIQNKRRGNRKSLLGPRIITKVKKNTTANPAV